MLEVYKDLYNSFIQLNMVTKRSDTEISELYPYYDPYKFFETYYYELYSTYKRNPSMRNKGKLEGVWELMVELLGARSNTVKNKIETRYALNKNR